jgi:hypothetical protein
MALQNGDSRHSEAHTKQRFVFVGCFPEKKDARRKCTAFSIPLLSSSYPFNIKFPKKNKKKDANARTPIWDIVNSPSRV